MADTRSPPDIGNTQVGINCSSLLSPLTGIGQYTFHLVTEMQHLLHCKPWLFYAASWSQEIRSQPVANINLVKDIIRSLLPNFYDVSRFFQQRTFSKGVQRHGIRLYHEPSFLAFRHHGPTVVTMHDLSWVRHPETQPSRRVRHIDRVMPEVVERADHIIADSEFVRQEIISHYGVAAERVTSVLLGVQPDFRPADAATCHQTLNSYGLRHGQYILAVGTLEPRKNLLTALAAYEQLPHKVRQRYPLVVAGSPGWNMEEISRSLNRMIERSEVIQVGYVPQADLPLLYAGARMLVFPSIYEGFGLPPLEAMASGVPVIVSNRASLPEVVGTAGILVEPMDDFGIMRQMLALIDDDELHARLSKTGHARAQDFTWRKCALDTLAVYEKVLKVIR